MFVPLSPSLTLKIRDVAAGVDGEVRRAGALDGQRIGDGQFAGRQRDRAGQAGGKLDRVGADAAALASKIACRRLPGRSPALQRRRRSRWSRCK